MPYEGNKQAALASIEHKQFTRSMQTLMGICSGLIADNQLNDQEIQYLNTWLTEYPETTNTWPGNLIIDSVKNILYDGIITKEEREQLLDTLTKITGSYFTETGAARNEVVSIDYSIDTKIIFDGMKFCFTGEFLLGTRSVCKFIVEKLGGKPTEGVSKLLDYLVVGTFVSDDWIYTSYGRKIEKAMQIRNTFYKPSIISEKQWTAAIRSFIQSDLCTVGISPEEKHIFLSLR